MSNPTQFEGLQQAYTSSFRKYQTISTRTHCRIFGLCFPTSVQERIDLAKEEKQECVAHEAYASARDLLMAYLAAGK
jgi:hypothetical protein